MISKGMIFKNTSQNELENGYSSAPIMNLDHYYANKQILSSICWMELIFLIPVNCLLCTWQAPFFIYAYMQT